MIWNALATDGTLTYGQGEPPAVGGDIIGVWDYDGMPIGAPNVTAYTVIRPLGNTVRKLRDKAGNETGQVMGEATTNLQYHYVMGHAPRMLGNPVDADPVKRLYPANNLPLVIEVRHKLFTGNSNPEWNGWGWRAEIVGGATSRSPAARAIGIYSDAACTAYLYTTGAFTQQPSAWQVNAEGLPLTVWATEYNPGLLGYPNDSKAPVHHACLLGGAQEGHATLWPEQESARHEFWLHNQGYVAPPAATWVDTRVTITQLVGAGVYRVSAVVSGLTIGQALRLGATATTAFNGYWPTAATPSDYIKITPHVSAAVGSKVWKWA